MSERGQIVVEDRPRLGRLAICALFGLVVAALPLPDSVPVEGGHVLATFAATILAFLLRPMPMGPVVLLALSALGVVETLRYKLAGVPKDKQLLTAKDLMAGFGDSTVWLVVAAFLLAGVMVRTGLGRRIALVLIVRLGSSMIGLARACCLSELCLAPFLPSNTARGGGVMAPIVDSLSRALGSEPGPTASKAGRTLMLVGAHANLITAAMFLTGMAANPLVAKAGKDILGVELTWGRWALGAAVPGLLALALLPHLILWLVPPEMEDVAAAREEARARLAELGPMTREQRGLGLVLVMLLLLWSTSVFHGLGTTTVAWLGLIALLVSGVQRWSDLCETPGAWDALIWLGGLVTLANKLRELGVIDWFAELVKAQVAGFQSLPPLAVLLVLIVIYHVSMYGFSMLTGHILALCGAFLALAKGFGAPDSVSLMLFACFSNLCGCTTNYSSGPIIIYFGLGYVDSREWFRIGAIMGLFHLLVWIPVGLLWWKLLGWW